MNKFKKTGFALRHQNCFLGGKEYHFVQGEAYVIDEEEVWNKLTNPVQPVLRPESRKKAPDVITTVKVKEYNEKTDKLRSRK